ncbi:MAG: PilN domain-containing protein, partial [Pseudomonadota bacterium]
IVDANIRGGLLAPLIDDDMERTTPFSKDRFHVLPTSGGGSSGYLVISREFWSAIIDVAHELGIAKFRGVFPTGDTSINVAIPISGARFRSMTPVFASLILALAAAAFLGSARNHWAAIQDVEQQISRLQPEVDAARRYLSRVRATEQRLTLLDQQMEAAPRVITVWEELSRILPDSSYLTDFSMAGTQLQFAGFSSEPTSVLPALQGSERFGAARLLGPMVRVPNQDRHRFSIELELES